MDDKSNKMPEQNGKVTLPSQKKPKPVKRTKGEAATGDFKSRYFAYYDDIKISDREDW